MAKKTKNVEETAEESTEVVKSVKTLTAVVSFKDKYTNILYGVGTKFVVDEKIKETTKVSNTEYKITAERAKELINNSKKVVE